jgi:hypothetical protein
MGNILTAQDVRKILIKDIPYLAQTSQVWIADASLSEIRPDQIKHISKNIPIDLKRTHGEKWDCDDIAINGMMEIKKWWKAYHQHGNAIAFGVGYGFRWRGLQDTHTANVFIYNGKTHCYDFQLDQSWQANAADELIYKVDI